MPGSPAARGPPLPRVVELTVPPERTDEALQRLTGEHGVLSVRVLRGVSVQPPGDVVAVEVLNRDLARVMHVADDLGLGEDGGVSLTTSIPQSVISKGSKVAVTRDRSTSSWEEMDLTIGRESTMTGMKLVVMCLAGLFAAAGLHTGALHVIIGAMLVAPAYEPLARVSLAAVNRDLTTLRGATQDWVTAYAALCAGAAAFAGLLLLSDADLLSEASYHRAEELERYWTTVEWTDGVVALAGGIGGAVLLVTNRRVLTTGIVIALALVPSLALAVVELLAGEPALAGRALLRWALDVVLVLVGCTLVFALKRLTDRRAMV